MWFACTLLVSSNGLLAVNWKLHLVLPRIALIWDFKSPALKLCAWERWWASQLKIKMTLSQTVRFRQDWRWVWRPIYVNLYEHLTQTILNMMASRSALSLGESAGWTCALEMTVSFEQSAALSCDQSEAGIGPVVPSVACSKKCKARSLR